MRLPNVLNATISIGKAITIMALLLVAVPNLVHSSQGKPMQIGDVFPLGHLLGKSGPIVLDSSVFTVIYFYPKDKTPGCTIEANEFQKLKSEFDTLHIRIVGVSVDDSVSHQAFCEKEKIAFELATDPKGALGNELDILTLTVHKRTTYVIDHDGHVILYYPAVKPLGHAQAVLTDIRKQAK
jgi:thioredoxin-dependent peroxiredoxin